MDLSDLYTSIGEAKDEINRRWNDKELRKKVEDFLGGDIPDFLKNEPRAALVRDVVSPNNEFFYFLDIVEHVGLKPIFIEYKMGKFVAKNMNKYHLCNMYFYNGVDKKGGYKIEHQRIVDFNTMEGKKFGDMQTLWGEKFINFHHNILHKAAPDFNMNDIVDFSEWFDRNRGKDEYYYLRYMSLFICHGVLFENFIMSNNERKFFEEKVFPILKHLTKLFGVKPLIVPIVSVELESDLWLWLYSGEIKKFLN